MAIRATHVCNAHPSHAHKQPTDKGILETRVDPGSSGGGIYQCATLEEHCRLDDDRLGYQFPASSDPQKSSLHSKGAFTNDDF